MHAQCNRDRACPAAEKVCTPDAYGCREAGSLGLRLPIRYHVADDKQSFTASSSMASDDATSYAGGVARPLTRRFMVDGSDMNGEDAPPEVIVPYDAGVPADVAGAP